MPYSREISRANKACFVFLLDQSFSMTEGLGGSASPKQDQLVLAINNWLQNMAIRATSDVGIKDWMDVAAIGYRTDQQGNPIIQPAFGGALAGRDLVSIADVGASPAGSKRVQSLIPDEETGEPLTVDVEVPYWVTPVAEGGTPMCHALLKCHEILSGWIAQHPDSFPPIVIHITDGESQDGDPVPYAEAVRSLATNDGNVLLFNCHLSQTAADPFMFPVSDEVLPDDDARTLFRMSSEIPDTIYRSAVASGETRVQPGAKGMAFNVDMVCLIRFLDMGTRAAVLR